MGNNDGVNKFFSAGLGRGSRVAAWAVACAGAVRCVLAASGHWSLT